MRCVEQRAVHGASDAIALQDRQLERDRIACRTKASDLGTTAAAAMVCHVDPAGCDEDSSPDDVLISAAENLEPHDAHFSGATQVADCVLHNVVANAPTYWPSPNFRRTAPIAACAASSSPPDPI
jgi:hypothetical protein